MTLQHVTDAINMKQASLGERVALHDVIGAVLADAVAVAIHDPSAFYKDGPFAELRTPRIGSELAKFARRLRKSGTDLSGALAVLREFRTVLRPIARSGIGSRGDDLWRLISLGASGMPMPVIAELLREPRTPNSKERKAAKDAKYLWRLRKGALRSLADEIAALLPTRMAA